MEQAAYQYTPYIEEQADFFSNEDLESLLATFSAVYPMVISVNLTQNRYCKLQYKDNAVRPHVDTGVFDELVAGIADTVHRLTENLLSKRLPVPIYLQLMGVARK